MQYERTPMKQLKEKEKETEEETETEEIEQEHHRIKKYFHSLFDIRDNMLSYEELDKQMREQAEIHGANMWILMLAILIASIGLNVNSTAVIIGAMLISPLMSGIMTMGYSITVRDIPLLIKAFVRFVTQVAICLFSSSLYFMLSPLTVPTSEMIARTSPTVWDVLIAIFGGLAGMIGHTRTKHSNVIPGVAIATALMPPLCTAGYGIASGQIKFFLGAFYLFIINTLFIAISTGIITIVLKVPYHKTFSKKNQHRVNAIISFIAILVIIPSVFFGAYTVYESIIDMNISHYLDKEFNFSETQVVKSETDKEHKVLSVSLVGTPVSQEITEFLTNRLAEYGLGEYTLKITQNVLYESEQNDKVTILLNEKTISELNNQIDTYNEKINEMQSKLDIYEKELSDYEKLKELSEKALKLFSHIENASIGVMFDSDKEKIVLNCDANEDISDYERNIISGWLCDESGIETAEINVRLKNHPEKTQITETVSESEN